MTRTIIGWDAGNNLMFWTGSGWSYDYKEAAEYDTAKGAREVLGRDVRPGEGFARFPRIARRIHLGRTVHGEPEPDCVEA